MFLRLPLFHHCQTILTSDVTLRIHVYLRKLWLFYMIFLNFRYTGVSNLLIGNRLGGLVVARSPGVRKGRGFNSRPSHTGDFKIGSRCLSAKAYCQRITKSHNS